MPRPCLLYPEPHEPFKPGCKLCELDDPAHARFSAAHHAMWNDPDFEGKRAAQAQVRTKPRAMCVHLDLTQPRGERDCPTCGGTVRLKTYACLAGHGDVAIADCAACEDHKGK